MEWFENWFDSDYYHLLYKERDQGEAIFFIDNLLFLLKHDKKAKILDLACGKGRHAIYLSNKGYQVTGLDLSVNNINYACKNKHNNSSFFVHDMRKCFRENYFDIVLNLFTSFGYFEKEKDHQEVIKHIAKSLKPDGVLVIDFMNSKEVMKNLILEEFKMLDQVEFKMQRFIKHGFIIKQINVKDKNKNNTYIEKVKALSLSDFQYYLNTAGLEVINLFGDYKLNTFDEESSERLIIVARKT